MLRSVIAVALLLATSCSSPEPRLPVPVHDLDLTVPNVAGCYRASIEWSPFPPADLTMSPPDFFELSAERIWWRIPPLADARIPSIAAAPPAFFELSSERLVYRGPRRVLVAGRGSFFMNWEVTDTQQLTISFGYGYTGVQMILRQRSSDQVFRGLAKPFSEGGPGQLPLGDAVLHRVSCGH